MEKAKIAVNRRDLMLACGMQSFEESQVKPDK